MDTRARKKAAKEKKRREKRRREKAAETIGTALDHLEWDLNQAVRVKEQGRMAEIPDWEQPHFPEESLKRIYAAAKSRGRVVLADFTKKLNHHLNRDIRRLHDYYETIAGEIQKR